MVKHAVQVSATALPACLGVGNDHLLEVVQPGSGECGSGAVPCARRHLHGQEVGLDGLVGAAAGKERRQHGSQIAEQLA